MNAGNLTDAEQSEVLREAYRKHSAELLAIEDSQQKLTALVLAILGAGGSFIAGMHQPLPGGARWGLTVLVVAIVLVGLVYTFFRSRARALTRELLVRCEEALGFYGQGPYIAGQTLYGAAWQQFPSRGRWLNLNYALVPAAAIGFLIVLWTI
jgi:hypothetical protein